ncbi:MAG: glucuronyl hydrolase [Proteobacteria bacterium SG_bin4]|nr:MAG: glucuronyl hydrolase [Proteobacteria bacterium SG_bin4]
MSAVYATGDRPVSTQEMIDAIESLFRRMDAIDQQCGSEFPLFSPGNSNTWKVSQGGSWAGGFWSACWWLRARVTDSVRDQRKASVISQQLAARTMIDSGYRSLIFWYGAALGALWFQDANAQQLTQLSVNAITHSFNPKLNCFPLGTAMGGGNRGSKAVTIDSFASMIQLLGSSDHNLHRFMVQRHTETMLTVCYRDNGAVHATAQFDGRGFEPLGQAGEWSRGQAWAMLGLSRAAALWGEPYITLARNACEYWITSRPNPLAPNRLGGSSSDYDPSASVIAALAMLSLANLLPDGESLRNYSHWQISAVLRSRYFTVLQTDVDSMMERRNGNSAIFWGCCYKTSPEVEELVESVWGSFFLMTVLCALTGFIEPGHC